MKKILSALFVLWLIPCMCLAATVKLGVERGTNLYSPDLIRNTDSDSVKAQENTTAQEEETQDRRTFSIQQDEKESLPVADDENIKASAQAEESFRKEFSNQDGFELSNGTIADRYNTGGSGPNGVIGETRCTEMGKRLPSLEELREMYERRDEIGGFTNGRDFGGWPYWSKKRTGQDNKDYAFRKMFSDGRFGDEGEEQYVPFWLRSGYGAYVRCVSDKK